MSISVSLAPVNTEVSVSSANDITVSLTNPTTTVEVNNQALSLPQSLGTGDSPTFSSVTAGSFVIAGADISEAELETIDAVTAGTVAANKAVVVDANKDISSFRNLTAGGTIDAGAITSSQTILQTGDTSISTSEFPSYVGKKLIYLGGAGEIDLPNVVAADIGKSWVILNAGTGALTIDIDGSGTAQYVRFLSGGSVDTSNSANRIIAAGGTAEIICIATESSGSIVNSASFPNYLIYGGGIS